MLAGCAGPSRQPLAETPTATTRRPPSLAPPASDADKDRYQLNQQFEDMRDAQQAHRESKGTNAAPPPGASAPKAPAPAARPPIKHGPAEQAPAQPAAPAK